MKADILQILHEEATTQYNPNGKDERVVYSDEFETVANQIVNLFKDKKYTYKEMRAFAVDFAYYIYGNDLGNLSHERHKQLFDEWIEAKLPQARG